MGRNPQLRINPKNPILSLHLGIDHLQLNYVGERDGARVFEGNLVYVMGTFVNDGNTQVYDRYREALKKSGFKII